MDEKPNLFNFYFEPNSESDKLILAVNSNPESSWKADECMLTKSHEKYDKNKCEQNSVFKSSIDSQKSNFISALNTFESHIS